MSFRLKWINKLDEDVYMYIIASSFGFIFCNATSSNVCHASSSNVCHIRYQLDIKIFFQYPDHSQSQIEDGYRKEITFLFSHLLIHCLYSCCGSLAFTTFCCIVFTSVVDPWYLQLFADPLPLQFFFILGLYSC